MSKKSIKDIKITTYDDLFKSEEQRQEEKLEKVMELPINELHEFKNHPFKIRQDEDMLKLIESVEENGVILPILVRPSPYEVGYEVISGHRRIKASEINGLNTITGIVRDLTDEQATIVMVDSNIQRENILPTERGFAYKMKLDAMKHQGKRTDLTSTQLGQKLKKVYSVEQLAQEVGETRTQIQRYIRLTELIEPLRDMVDGLNEDNFKIAFNPAVELSYLSEQNQYYVLENIESLLLTPSHAQAIRMKELSKAGRLNENVIYSIMSEEKPNQKEKLSIRMDEISSYFSKDYSQTEMINVIKKLLKDWSKKQKRSHER